MVLVLGRKARCVAVSAVAVGFMGVVDFVGTSFFVLDICFMSEEFYVGRLLILSGKLICLCFCGNRGVLRNFCEIDRVWKEFLV